MPFLQITKLRKPLQSAALCGILLQRLREVCHWQIHQSLLLERCCEDTTSAIQIILNETAREIFSCPSDHKTQHHRQVHSPHTKPWCLRFILPLPLQPRFYLPQEVPPKHSKPRTTATIILYTLVTSSSSWNVATTTSNSTNPQLNSEERLLQCRKAAPHVLSTMVCVHSNERYLWWL